MKLNEKLIELRKQKGLSQEQLSYHLDVSRQAISRWENGVTQPDLDHIDKLCKIYDITPDELLGYQGKDRKQTSKQIFIIIGLVLAVCGLILGLNIGNRSNYDDYHHFYVDALKMMTIEETETYKKYNLSYMPSVINESFEYTIVVNDEKGNVTEFEAILKGNIVYSVITLQKDEDVIIYAQVKLDNLKYSSPLIKVWAMKEG